jgi:lycopene beta-cyclase
MSKGNEYDIIIAGAGCAGLSLLMRMIRSGKFASKKILLVDKSPKLTNDRTWCFWEKKAGFFDNIVFRKWNVLDFFSDTYSTELNVSPYEYKMIRGIDFYNYCNEEIARHTNIHTQFGEFRSTFVNRELAVNIGTDLLRPGRPLIFSSIPPPVPTDNKAIRLLQHFKGWVIETPVSSFNPLKAVLMDFRVDQRYGTSFTYVLPFSETKALIEYTQFTRSLISGTEYDQELRTYIGDCLRLKGYKVISEEFGVIPMTNEKFPFFKDGVYHIGSAGGQTKASSGYTFQFIQKQSEKIVECLLNDRPLSLARPISGRFRFYDNTFLYILFHNMLPGKRIFTDLFRKNDPRRVLRFLDNESSFADELKIVSSLPTWPFLKAALRNKK